MCKWRTFFVMVLYKNGSRKGEEAIHKNIKMGVPGSPSKKEEKTRIPF